MPFCFFLNFLRCRFLKLLRNDVVGLGGVNRRERQFREGLKPIVVVILGIRHVDDVEVEDVEGSGGRRRVGSVEDVTMQHDHAPFFDECAAHLVFVVFGGISVPSKKTAVAAGDIFRNSDKSPGKAALM